MISWDLPTSAESWVVYDSVSRSDIADYAAQSGAQGSWFSAHVEAALDTSSLTIGDSLYFRVVTQDVAGNLAWSAEQRISIPPRFTAIEVAQPAGDSYV